MAGTTATATPPNPQPNLQNEFVTRSAWKQGVLGAVNVFAAVLAARLILLIAVVGAIWLTVQAIATPDPLKLAALGIYALVVVVPTVWLASRR
jgi:hypothetical protein